MLEAIAGLDRGDALHTLVLDADRKSVERDLRTHQAALDASLGVPVEKFLLDALRRLVRDGHWTSNQRGARVCLGLSDACPSGGLGRSGRANGQASDKPRGRKPRATLRASAGRGSYGDGSWRRAGCRRWEPSAVSPTQGWRATWACAAGGLGPVKRDDRRYRVASRGAVPGYGTAVHIRRRALRSRREGDARAEGSHGPPRHSGGERLRRPRGRTSMITQAA
jgi:hypothetical protein